MNTKIVNVDFIEDTIKEIDRNKEKGNYFFKTSKGMEFEIEYNHLLEYVSTSSLIPSVLGSMETYQNLTGEPK